MASRAVPDVNFAMPKSQLTTDELATLYNSGLTLSEVGQRAGMSKQAVRQRLIHAGIYQKKSPAESGQFRWTQDNYPTPRPSQYGDAKDESHIYRRIVFGIQKRPRLCERCGSDTHIVVHHRDEDRANNHPDNLEVLCKRCHQRHHLTAEQLASNGRLGAAARWRK